LDALFAVDLYANFDIYLGAHSKVDFDADLEVILIVILG